LQPLFFGFLLVWLSLHQVVLGVNYPATYRIRNIRPATRAIFARSCDASSRPRSPQRLTGRQSSRGQGVGRGKPRHAPEDRSMSCQAVNQPRGRLCYGIAYSGRRLAGRPRFRRRVGGRRLLLHLSLCRLAMASRVPWALSFARILHIRPLRGDRFAFFNCIAELSSAGEHSAVSGAVRRAFRLESCWRTAPRPHLPRG
jgi:hypothetical protein